MSRSGRVSAAAGNDLDIVLASRLARASTTDPYWKQRTNKLPADGKEVAKLKKQLSELSKDFHALLGVHEKSDASLQDVQGKIKLLRQELSSKDKQLDLCRRTVDRLTEEKAQNEGSIAADKAYIRKLENRLLSVKNAAELQSKCIEYRVQVEDMAHQLQLAESRAASAEEALQQQKQEQAFLKRGIELAAEQLTKSSGTEVPTTLLMAVARAQEDGMSMSVQLADSKQQLAQMASALQHARSHLLEQQKTSQKLQEQTQEHSHKLHSTLAELESEKVAGAELRHISASLKQHVSKLNKERDALRHQLELERTSTVAAEEKAQQLEAELMEQSQIEGSLRSQLRQLQAAAQQHKQQQHQTVVQRGPSGRRDVEQPKHKRPTAPTPNRGSGAVRHATSMSTSLAGRSTERPIQRLRQQRQQHRRGLVSPEPAQPRALNGTGISRPKHAVFDVQLLGNEHIPTGNDMRGPGHAQTEHKPSYPLLTTAPHDGRQEGVHPTEKLTDLYVSALDQQIAMIEGDLAGLSASCSPTRLQEALQGLQRSAGGQGASGPHQREACRPQQCGDAGAGKRATKQGNSGAAAVGMAPPEVAGLCAAPPHAGGTKAGVPAGASTQKTPSKGPATRVHEPSPSKLLQPGWLAGQSSTPASPVIGAWRPNGTFEPTDTDVVVMQASMPEASAMLGSVDQVHNGSKPSGKMLRPSALIIPSTAHDRYGNELLSQSTPEECLLSHQSGISSIRPSSTGSARLQGPAGQGPSPGLVWHSNPLAQATPDAATGPAPSAAPGNEHLSNTPVGGGAAPATNGPVARRPSSSQSSGNKVQPTSRWMDEEDAARSSLPLGAGNPPTVPSQGGCTQQEQPGAVPLSTDSCSRVGCAEPTLSSEVSWDWQRGPTPPPTQQRMQRSPDGGPCHHKQRGHQAAGASSWWAGEPDHPLLGSAQGRPTSPAWEPHQLRQGAHDEDGDTSEPQAVDCREGVSGDLQPQQQGNVPPRAVARPGSRAALGGSPGLVGGRLRWSVASGASSWLNTAYEPDIEQLEVKSHRKPARAQPRDSHKSLAEDKTEQYQQDAGGKQSGSAGDTPSGRPEPSLATLFELATMDLDCL